MTDPMYAFFVIVGKITCALLVLAFLTLLVIVTAGKYPWLASQLARVVNWMQPDDTKAHKQCVNKNNNGQVDACSGSCTS